jgi:hypothetical protein
VLALGLYMGSYEICSSGGSYYIYVPIKLASQLKTRKVRVVARVDARGCEDSSVHGAILAFPATLTKVGSSYRIRLPNRYSKLAERIHKCGSVELWLEPI